MPSATSVITVPLRLDSKTDGGSTVVDACNTAAPANHRFPFPDKGASVSFWLQGVNAAKLLDARTTEDLPDTADLVIIGSGLSGASVAHFVQQCPDPPKRIVMLEAREFASGATGRNAGHCKPDRYRSFARFSKAYGPEQAKKIIKNDIDTFEKVVDFIQRNDVDCDLWVGQSLDVMVTDELAAVGNQIFEDFRKAGGNVEGIERVMDAREAAKRSRLKNAKAVYSWESASLYPWKLASHLVSDCIKRGLNLQTWCPVQRVSETQNKDGLWTIETPRGQIKTPRVVHATNAYAGAILPELSDMIDPTPFMCTKVVPPRAFAGSKALPGSIYTSLPGGAVMTINPRSTSDGICLVAGVTSAQPALSAHLAAKTDIRTSVDDSLGDFEPINAAVESFLSTQLDGWEINKVAGGGGKVEFGWSGIIGYSRDGVPFIGAVPGKDGQWVLAGFHGHGMVRIFTAAAAIATLMGGGSWEDTNQPDVFHLTAERLDRVRAKGGIKMAFA